jgi:hypothetical protein
LQISANQNTRRKAMLNFNFKITENGNTYYMNVTAYNLIAAYQEVRETYPEGRIVVL